MREASDQFPNSCTVIIEEMMVFNCSLQIDRDRKVNLTRTFVVRSVKKTIKCCSIHSVEIVI